MKAVILVGGFGTRLRPLTYTTCKAMLPVLNRPFLEHMFCYLKRHQVDDIILSMGYLPDKIQEYFGDGSKFGVKLHYAVEDSPLGTAGAAKNAEQYLDNGAFFVFNGDIFTNIDLTAMLNFHRERLSKATIALTPVEDPSQFGVVETDEHGWVKAFIEKPPREKATTNMINAGIYILEPEVLARVPPRTKYMFEHHVFPDLLRDRMAVYGFPTKAYWIDMGTPQKYMKLQCDLLDNVCAMDRCVDEKVRRPPGTLSQTGGAVIIGARCNISNGVQIKGPTVLGPGCNIMEGAVIEGSVLWSNVEVGRQAKLVNCILGDNCVIGDKCQVQEGTVLGSNVVIKGYQ